MAWDLGDVVPLSVTVTNPAGQAEDATAVHLTITLPDGTSETYGPIASTTAGVYDYDYATVQAGRHVARWVATGTNASAYVDAFDVTPIDGGDFISLADAQDHLKLTSTGDEEKLRGFVAAACQMITDRVGQVAPLTVVHDVTGCGRTVVLPARPVIAVTSVEELPGLTTIPEADPAAQVDGWALTSAEGVLTLTRPYRAVRVTYRAGRNPVPANYRLAALELTAHLWRTSQLNTGGGRPPVGVDEVVVPGVTFALPYNVRQLLGLDKRPQDEVLVG
ncbi:hypothetical protein FLW53_09600 [Microbispora sp. SCL1-1]|uniref:hypothetical protein n=1 Tax=unclassified Microbispora TaxID=2614687 RepID=UPI00115788E5|nr:MULTISPECIES: hypothetical protein [unclassified Microbispora]NJP24458.1 hypothetical protein [Microbispora sp. CL1-1]TQS14604.1 hypothetical protein FLW53_09600 [Microbispora sp. SCL1-1]